MPKEIEKADNKKLFERFMLVFATVEPIATIPQIYQVWTTSHLHGVSIFTWIFYTLTSAVWLFYGFYSKDKPIIVSGFLWVGTQALVVLGILVH